MFALVALLEISAVALGRLPRYGDDHVGLESSAHHEMVGTIYPHVELDGAAEAIGIDGRWPFHGCGVDSCTALAKRPIPQADMESILFGIKFQGCTDSRFALIVGADPIEVLFVLQVIHFVDIRKTVTIQVGDGAAGRPDAAAGKPGLFGDIFECAVTAVVVEAIFTEVARILKPNGKLLIAEHGRDLPNFIAFGLGVLSFFSPNTWSRHITEAGLSLQHHERWRGLVHLWIAERKVG